MANPEKNEVEKVGVDIFCKDCIYCDTSEAVETKGAGGVVTKRAIPDQANGYDGLCRRRAAVKRQGVPYFPVVRSEVDWCGERQLEDMEGGE